MHTTNESEPLTRGALGTNQALWPQPDRVGGRKDAFLRVDTSGTVVGATGSLMTVLGYRQDQLEGRAFAQLLMDSQDGERFLRAARCSSAAVRNYFLLLRRDDGVPVWGEASARRWRDAAGRLVGVECAFHYVGSSGPRQTLCDETRQAQAILDSIGRGRFGIGGGDGAAPGATGQSASAAIRAAGGGAVKEMVGHAGEGDHRNPDRGPGISRRLPGARGPDHLAMAGAPLSNKPDNPANHVFEGLDEGRFRLFRQRIAPARNDAQGASARADHYEVLLRMVDEEGHMVLPGEFLPAVEEQGMASTLDEWVVDATLELISTHESEAHTPDSYSVNVSGQSIGSEAFLSHVVSSLDRTGVDPERVCFEVTETAAVESWGEATKFMRTLKALGCKFSLDDFGTGHCSFAYLKNLPVDCLKIDGMFVKGIVNDTMDRAIVESVNNLAHIMGLETVAEYVENERILDLLREIGVDYVQGYAVNMPHPMEERVPLRAAA